LRFRSVISLSFKLLNYFTENEIILAHTIKSLHVLAIDLWVDYNIIWKTLRCRKRKDLQSSFLMIVFRT